MSNISLNVSPETSAVDAKAVEERREELKKRAGRFRILIVGRANAGKTTILKKICNTTNEPEIYNSKGEQAIVSHHSHFECC
jgi:septin family protein